MIKEIAYSDVIPFWSEKLWPGRELEKTSQMIYFNWVDHDARNLESQPIFFGAFADDKLVGVNSGHMCGDGSFRSRGLWVDEEYRGRGIGVKLLEATIQKGKELGAHMCWSYPRRSSWPSYERAGFTQTSGWIQASEQNAYCCYIYES